LPRPARVFGCCLLILPLVGSVSRREESRNLRPPNQITRKSVQEANLKAAVLFRSARYSEAGERFAEIRKSALGAGYLDLAARATGNQGGSEFALHRYQEALSLFLEAHKLARAGGDSSAAAGLDANIGSLYAQMGELDAAVQWLQQGLDRLRGSDRADHLAEAQLEMASLRARQNRWSDAVLLFGEGLDGADSTANTALLAKGFQRLGEEQLRRNDLAAAERALLEAYRLRKLNRLPLDGSYCYLGKLRLAQGDYTGASALMDLAVAATGTAQSSLPVWDVYLTRGRIRLAQGRLSAALDDLHIARRFANAWRWSLPSDDTSRIGAESRSLTQVYDALIETCNRLYEQTGNPDLIRESFEAAEENRANSLSTLVRASKSSERELPPAYWEAVARLQRAETQALRTGGGGGNDESNVARAELVRLDAAYLPAADPMPEHLAARVQAALDGDSAILAFHLGEQSSWLWSLEKSGLALYRLPAAAEIRKQVDDFAQTVRDDSPRLRASGARLCGTLFGSLPSRTLARERWLLALDTALFDAPFPAMTADAGSSRRYLIESHVISVIPGAAYWLDSRSRTRTAMEPVFVGVGDPVYNIADPRAAGLKKQQGSRTPTGAVQLPRLVGSGTELDACARSWGGESVLLKGASASRDRLIAEMPRNPAVLHLATHVLESAGQSPTGLIALSLTKDLEPELLSPSDISHWKSEAGLVVLSGCHSAGAAVLAGTGLMGLTRSWLMAGARAVIGSRWATPDEDGALFVALYGSMKRNPGDPDPSRALRDAQLLMLRSGGFRSRPRYWGAFFLMGSV
jgi:CHAT domain-containing protein